MLCREALLLLDIDLEAVATLKGVQHVRDGCDLHVVAYAVLGKREEQLLRVVDAEVLNDAVFGSDDELRRTP